MSRLTSVRHGLGTLVSVLVLLLSARCAQAAGGHFDVDDATIVVPGNCIIEQWTQRITRRDFHTLHLGPACRVGEVEAGINLDRSSDAGAHSSSAGAQLKWVADPLLPRVSAGIVVADALDLASGREALRTVYVPVTWWASQHFFMHMNVGRDWTPDGATKRIGTSVEWLLTDSSSVIVERMYNFGDRLSRLGWRIAVTDKLMLDLSGARLRDGARAFILELDYEFTR